MNNKLNQYILKTNRVTIIIAITVVAVTIALYMSFAIDALFDVEENLAITIAKTTTIPIIIVPIVGWYLVGLIFELDRLKKR